MSAAEFASFQKAVCEKSKAGLWTSWVPKAAEVFRRIPPVCINGDANAYFAAMATLQSNQLRAMVTDALHTYVEFFREYEARDDVDP